MIRFNCIRDTLRLIHVVFTLPDVLNKTALHEPKMLYDFLFALKKCRTSDISMLVMNVEISASVTTPAETVTAQNVREKNENTGLKIGKPNCFRYLILLIFYYSF